MISPSCSYHDKLQLCHNGKLWCLSRNGENQLLLDIELCSDQLDDYYRTILTPKLYSISLIQTLFLTMSYNQLTITLFQPLIITLWLSNTSSIWFTLDFWEILKMLFSTLCFHFSFNRADFRNSYRNRKWGKKWNFFQKWS